VIAKSTYSDSEDDEDKEEDENEEPAQWFDDDQDDG
jgi:hypothetical protein